MFSIIQRTQGIGNLLLTISITLGVLITLSSYVQLYLNDFKHIPGHLEVVKSMSSKSGLRKHGGTTKQPKQSVKINFNLDADLSPLFNWNTKQVFVYLTAEYPGLKENEESKVIFWDKILRSADKAKLSLVKQRGKYNCWDVYPDMTNRTSTLKLKYNIQPYVGPLIYGELDSAVEFQFPDIE